MEVPVWGVSDYETGMMTIMTMMMVFMMVMIIMMTIMFEC